MTEPTILCGTNGWAWSCPDCPAREGSLPHKWAAQERARAHLRTAHPDHTPHTPEIGEDIQKGQIIAPSGRTTIAPAPPSHRTIPQPPTTPHSQP